MNATTKLSVVAPMYNEEGGIELFLQEVIKVLSENFLNYELILVDDGSTDNTVSKAIKFIQNHPFIRLIIFSRNYGHEIASTAGLEQATGDCVVLMDSDLQHPPSLIPEMVDKMQEGYDVVCGARINRDEESWTKRKITRLFYRLSANMSGLNIDQNVGNFRLMNRNVLDALKKMKENNRHLVTLFAYLGFKTTYIPYHCHERVAGKSKYTWMKLISLALDSIIGFSHRPLRLMSILSILISFSMMIYAGFILLQKFFTSPQLADGVASVIFLVSALFSVLFLFLAILSEYISRISIETKNRPLYNIHSQITYESLKHEDE